jgi:hypothetical protein
MSERYGEKIKINGTCLEFQMKGTFFEIFQFIRISEKWHFMCSYYFWLYDMGL